MPEVSVVIAAYNGEWCIGKTIESVLGQTYSDLELIIVDDGSTDGTREIISSYLTDKRVKYIYQENQGVSQARNNGVALAKGIYIAFLDHDDLWFPEKLTRQIPLFESNLRVGLVFSDAFISNTFTGAESRFFESGKPCRGAVREHLFLWDFVPLLTSVVRKTVLDQTGGFDPQFTIAEDYELFLRIARVMHFDYVDEPLARYLIHATNLSRDIELTLTENIQVQTNYWNEDKELQRRLSGKGRRCLANLYSARGRERCLKGNTPTARADFREAMRWSAWSPGPYIYWLLALMGKNPMTWGYALSKEVFSGKDINRSW
ncbi:glycosyltransferase [bacterium]|nr:glycosyltransferase [bacterium]